MNGWESSCIFSFMCARLHLFRIFAPHIMEDYDASWFFYLSLHPTDLGTSSQSLNSICFCYICPYATHLCKIFFAIQLFIIIKGILCFKSLRARQRYCFVINNFAQFLAWAQTPLPLGPVLLSTFCTSFRKMLTEHSGCGLRLHALQAEFDYVGSKAA